MGTVLLCLRLAAAIIVALLIGKLVTKLKLPAILGWLLTGIIFGPHAVSLINHELLDASWYQTSNHVLECAVGLMIGTELVWERLKKSGKQIIITTLTQSLGTFFFVSLVFGVIFYFSGIPLYLAAIFGGIALATAPAPALSIVREFKTDGPVTRTLIPMAAMDDMVGVFVFFTVISLVASSVSEGGFPPYMSLLIIFLPLIIGAVNGGVFGWLMKGMTSGHIFGCEVRSNHRLRATLIIMICGIIVTAAVGFVFNSYVMPSPLLNFMLMGMAFSAVFSNMIPEKQLEMLMSAFNPILGIAMVIVILNLGAPLDYHLIVGAGVYTAVYIVSRALGKYFGAYFGASITHSPDVVKKYLGFTLLPHSGVSLVFTGIAVSTLSKSAPECAAIIQGTIAAAAIINEVLAVIIAKKGFEWSGEFGKAS